jgi:3-oxoacyl-[acyl-carrier-protein] synthase-3
MKKVMVIGVEQISRALEEGRIRPGANVLLTSFDGGLTWAAVLLRWGERVDPAAISAATLPPCEKMGLEIIAEMVRQYRANPA